jgi:rhodanese-related sulfurtransferase
VTELELSVQDLAAQLASGADLQLVDVREDWEAALVRIAGAIHMPMQQIDKRRGELDASKPTVVYCHHGIRSMHVALFLRSHGFTDVKSLRGGIERWATEIDPTLARY